MLSIFGLIMAGAFGAIFGSYCTLFAYRLPLNESCFGRYFGPKSRCPNCQKVIRTRELIPLFNWLFTLGRCVFCKAKIPRTYLFIEIATTLLFMYCYSRFSFSEQFIIFALLSASLVTAIAIDYSNKILPTPLLVTILIVGLVNRVLVDEGIINVIISAGVGVIFAAFFYQVFCKRFSGLLLNQKQALDYANFIIIVSVSLNFTLFLLYFLTISIILMLLLLIKSVRNRNYSLGCALILPFMWLIFNPPF